MPQILAIETAGPDRRARRLHLSDETELTVAGSVVRALALQEGDEVPEPDALRAEELTQARERALRLLSHRDRSRAELLERLERDGYPVPVVDETIKALQRVDLIDDARFAELYVRSKVAAGFGARRIAQELARKGISEEFAADALRGMDDDAELERARAALRGQHPSDRRERERLLRRLVARGFELDVALRALSRDAGSIEEGP